METAVTVSSFSALAHRSIHGNATTTKASLTKRLEISINLLKNPHIEKEVKNLYIQVRNPQNNVIGKKGAIAFGEQLLIYSDRYLWEGQGQELNIKRSIHLTDSSFVKGIYYVSVFLDDEQLVETQIVLN